MLAVFLYLFFMYFCIDKSTKNARSMSAVGFAKGSAIEALTAAEGRESPTANSRYISPKTKAVGVA